MENKIYVFIIDFKTILHRNKYTYTLCMFVNKLKISRRLSILVGIFWELKYVSGGNNFYLLLCSKLFESLQWLCNCL